MEKLILTGLCLCVLHAYYGIEKGWYLKYGPFGPLVHFVGGMFLGLLTGNFYIGVLLAVGWECFEALFDYYFPDYSEMVCWYSRSFHGALRDIFWSAIGIAAILIW